MSTGAGCGLPPPPNCGRLGINIDVTDRLGNLSLGAQQLVEIARVVFSGAEIIILDEPTSALSVPEAERLFQLMRGLQDRGKSLIFISHFLEDVLAVADRVTVLKNARNVATLPNQGLTKQRLIELMIGSDATNLAESYSGGVTLPPPPKRKRHYGDYRPTGSRCVCGRRSDCSGRRDRRHLRLPRRRDDRGGPDPLRATQAAERRRSNSTAATIAPRSPSAAKKLGIAYLTENRRATIFPRHEIYKNVTLAHLDHLVRPRLPSDPREVSVTQTTGAAHRASAQPQPTMLAGHLSGGNQQKVVLAKWLTRQPRLLILNEPTRGMDVGAKREVLDLIKSLKAEGVAILLLSTEPETVLAESDRILVMSKGRITKEFTGERVSKDLLMEYA